MSRHPSYRYGPWRGGRDPLEPPFDVAEALDSLGDDVLDGASAQEALRELFRSGTERLRGLESLREKVRQRMRNARRATPQGTLDEARRLLDQAIGQERATLFPDPGDAARMAESELDALPADTARAVRELADYPWRSAEAAASYEQIRELLRKEVLTSQFEGMKQALGRADEQEMARVKDMLADLNQMLTDARRDQHTQQNFDEFMDKHGDMFPEQPENLDELVETLARRAQAQRQLLDALSDEQRNELAGLMSGAMSDTGLESELDQLRSNLSALRPDLASPAGRDEQHQRRQGQPMGLGDATTALAETAELAELDAALSQDYPGASLSDVDQDQVERALGRAAVDDLAALKRIERELTEQGYLTQSGDQLALTPRAVRRLGSTALRRVFSRLSAPGRGGHDTTDAGAAGDLIGSTRAWEYGDEQPLDVVRTVRNAVLRGGPPRHGRAVRLAVEDFEVAETERRSTAAVALLVDLSYSMALRNTWGTAKSTALALHSLITTQYPQDAIEIIGFSDRARVLHPTELAGLTWDTVQGTNLQHALMLANRYLGKHPDAEPVVMVVTDGEPTAHLTRSGQPVFCWPPLPETLELTFAEVERCTRRGATINMFMLEPDPRLIDFGEEIGRRNGGRVFTPNADRLGDYVVQDYLRSRRGRR